MSEREYITHCKRQIELKYNLDGAKLTERDYEYLHEVILEETRTDLSTSTLRRLWTDYSKGSPQIKTLDALAQTLGYAGWHVYKQTFSKNERIRGSKAKRTALYASSLSVVVISCWLFIFSDEVVKEVMLEPEVFIHEGVPATVGFNYIVSNPEVEIELSWNPYERVTLDVEKNFYTGTYYYPDYHKAKLLYQDQVLAMKFVHITTNGWHALLMDSGMDLSPQYIDSSDFIFSDRLKITKETVEKLTNNAKVVYPVFTLSSTSLEQLKGDSFSLVAKVEMAQISEGTLCLMYEVLIKGSGGNMRIPVMQTGCYGIATLTCAEKMLTGKSSDLSDLSTDVEQRHSVKISTRDRKLKVEVGENQAYELDYEKEIGPLKVVKFIFNGLPEVSKFELRDDKDQVEIVGRHPFRE